MRPTRIALRTGGTRGVLLSAFLLTAFPLFAAEVEKLPWQINPPIVTVEKEIYKKHPRPRTAALVSVAAVGSKLELCEVHSFETQDDVHDEITARWSTDNGRTWSKFVPIQPSSNVDYGGVTVGECGGAASYDVSTGLHVGMWLRQIQQGGLYHNFTYVRTSPDFGRVWSVPTQLIYEPGDAFDPAKPLNPQFLNHNEGYFGNNVLVRSDGTLLCCLAHANAPGDPKNDQRPWRMGSVLFLGKWNAQRREYEWTPGARAEISPEHSARGLMEPELAELSDGRILLVWRGSTHGWDGTVAKLPGCKFFSISSDGGRTLTPPEPWRYADGSSFYSPSSIHRMIRHSVTGKLYWFGNISAIPPSGNSPRYPLIVAEVDEERAALKKATVTVIDDRGPDQGPGVQFSNFSLYEDQETHTLILHLTTYGQDPESAAWATADNYRYVVSLEEQRRRPVISRNAKEP